MMTYYCLFSNRCLAHCFLSFATFLPVVIVSIHFYVTALKDKRELKVVKEISQLSKEAKKFTPQKNSFGLYGKVSNP